MYIRFTERQRYDSHDCLVKEVQPITPNLVFVLFNSMMYFLSGVLWSNPLEYFSYSVFILCQGHKWSHNLYTSSQTSVTMGSFFCYPGIHFQVSYSWDICPWIEVPWSLGILLGEGTLRYWGFWGPSKTRRLPLIAFWLLTCSSIEFISLSQSEAIHVPYMMQIEMLNKSDV